MLARATALALLVCTACGREEGAPPPAGATTQARWGGFYNQGGPRVIVLAVDDGPSSEAALLRTKVAGEFAEEMRDGLRSSSQRLCSLAADPAAWPFYEERVVVVRPSATVDDRWRTPSDDPNLVLSTNLWTPDSSALANAVETALADPPVSTGAAYGLLDAVQTTVALITGNRTPATDAERHVASLGPEVIIDVVIVTTRDDESTGPVGSYALPYGVMGEPVVTALLPSKPGACSEYGMDSSAAPRLDEWIKPNPIRGWPCSADQPSFLDLFWAIDCGPKCLTSPIVVDEDGSAQCRVEIELWDQTSCDPARGWIDPVGDDGVRRPKMATDEQGKQHRVCEIQELTGDALTQCRTTLECNGCGSGWCRTEVAELGWSDSYCSSGIAARLRFVGGALADAKGDLDATCNLVASTPAH